MRKKLLTLSGAIGLGLFSQSVLAGCYCQVGHLTGNARLIPDMNSNSGKMIPVNPICTADAIPSPEPRRKEYTTEEILLMHAMRDIYLSFSPKTGQYGVVVHNLREETSRGRFYTKEDLQKFSRIECVAKENNDTFVSLASKASKRATKKQANALLKNSSCQVLETKENIYNRLILMRGQTANGNWQSYYLQYYTNYFDFAFPQAEFESLRSQCQKETKQCEVFDTFGATTGVF